MTWQKFANRRQYDISCPDNIHPVRWKAMTRQWDSNPIESFFAFVIPYDEISDSRYCH